MLFNSWGYVVFMLVFVSLDRLLPSAAMRVRVLALASCSFYAMWRWEFTFLVVFSALVDYVAGLRISASNDERVRRRWLAVSLAINLGLLIGFKYTYFIYDNVRIVGHVVGTDLPALDSLGVRIILPLGISFYTFQTMSYSIDIYRRVAEPVKDFWLFLAYVMFWPQLIAGPILRAGEVIPALASERRASRADINEGLTLILYGLAKKVILADTIGAAADAVFRQDVQWFNALDVWAASFLFGLQIYFDFSGYSTIAIGSALILGIRFPENFNWPYLARSPREFWSRWHISLSSWIRDYLYLPLTGQRFQTRSEGGLRDAGAISDRRRDAALLATWFIMGLWHGAAWTFALWGLFHAVWILLYRVVRPLNALPDRWPVLAWLLTLFVAMAGWIPFRATNVSDTFTMWSKLVTPSAYRWSGHRVDIYTYALVAAVMAGTALAWLAWGRRPLGATWPPLLRHAMHVIGIAVLVCGVLLSMRRVQQFIYFQF